MGWWGKTLPDAFVPEEVKALHGNDLFAKRRLLYHAGQGAQEVPVEDVLETLKDQDAFVRRRALDALAAIREPATIPTVEDSLGDPEHSVRCWAAVLLGDFHGPDSMEKLFAAVKAQSPSPHFLEHCAVPSICKMAQGNPGGFVARITDHDKFVRRAALFALQSPDMSLLPAATVPLIRCLKHDPDPYNREIALAAAERYAQDLEIQKAVIDALDDRDEMVRVQAADALAEMLSSIEIPTRDRQQALARMEALLRGYASTVTTPESDETGWRRLGEAIQAFGQEGEAILRAMMEQKHDYPLSDLAWRILYLPRRKTIAFDVTEEQDRVAHEHRPVLSLG